ncbi:hypothetical protein EZS27_026183 [termite gut metagenome]|uniref:Uncharacterized protein n=1 Tax=termite gut metagenome TaxID=433724 RepID=A0A5J4QUM4_9ZZZZ
MNSYQYRAIYRELYVKNENLKEEVEDLQEQKEATKEEVRHVYDLKDEARDKFLAMDEYAKQKNKELATIETKLQKVKQAYEPYRAQEELNLIHELFPMMKEQLRIAVLYQKIGDSQLKPSENYLMALLCLLSPEHKQYFEVKDAKVKIEKESDSLDKPRLAINGTNIIDWFMLEYKEVCEVLNSILESTLDSYLLNP